MKRTLTTLGKESDSLLKAPEGLPEREFTDLGAKLRQHLDIIRTVNNTVITLSIDELNAGDYGSKDEYDQAVVDVENKETAYIDEVSDDVLQKIRDLQRKAEEILSKKPKPPPKPTVATPAKSTGVSSRMAKLKFPTFSGDIRDYRKFRDQFTYFTKTLEPDEQLYQLVESMERTREKQKIKNCMSITKAWSILDSEYGDKDRLIDILLSDLEKIETYHNKGNINIGHMARFVETLQNFSTHFESLGMSSDLNGRVMLTQLRRKLPEEHHIDFLKAVADRKAEDTILGLQHWLYEQLTILRKARPPPPIQDSSARNKTSHSKANVSHTSLTPSTVKDTSFTSSVAKETSPASSIVKDAGQRVQGKKKCPLHPNLSNHFIKGCNKFRSLSQREKFDIMNKNGICHRCGHDDCISGKAPYDPQKCQHYRPCGVPTCGADTHFSSICPRVYGIDGYRHFEMKAPPPTVNMNPVAQEFTPVKELSTVVPPVGKSVPPNSNSPVTCVLPTVMAYLKHGNRRYLVRVLLDTGSQASLVREGIIPLSSDNTFQNYEITTAGGGIMQRNLRVLDCEIEDLSGSINRKISLVEIRKPCGDVPVIRKNDLMSYPHLRDVEINEAQSPVIDILLGVDSGNLITPDARITGVNDLDPVAGRCPLGWFIQGGSGSSHVKSAVNFTLITPSSELEEFLGIENTPLTPKYCKCAVERENKRATEFMKNSLRRLYDGTYQVKLPWRKSPTALPNNYDYAKRRLENLEKQF
ncbi:MAG: hypothetical protein MJA29_13770, partial [Candidatus Omnitrophica bacterium]|nr:hypothetical protein [Candidatus Omnitrophota bacterium]